MLFSAITGKLIFYHSSPPPPHQMPDILLKNVPIEYYVDGEEL